MNEQTYIIALVILLALFFALWTFTSRQSRKYEEAKRQRKLDIERLKQKAREKQNNPSEE